MLLFNNYFFYQFLINTKFLFANTKIKTTVSLFIFSIILSNLLSWTTIFSTTWVSGFVALIGAQYLGVQGSLLLLFINVLVLLLKTLPLFYDSLMNQTILFYNLGDYAALTDNYCLQLQILLDSYSLSYIVLTNTIGLWALLFATNYMRGEPRILNFLYLLYFFLISMILLLASGNFPTLMLGWELIGCFSFLLINFWTTRIGTAKSAFKAFFFNKLSDASLILSFVILILFLPHSFSLNFSNLYLLQGLQVTILNTNLNISHIFILGVVICSFCKSAQFGLHIWLPDSMEAPVPASALIHSATLVSAGIFLLGRHEILTSLNWLANFLLIWCSFTALYGGIVAAYQTDLKKILAYSTISHCGFLFLLVVYNNFYGLVLYLHLHGWFKSYSFMAAGNIISKYLGYQDYRRMGGSVNFTTIESLVLTVSISCLGGLPFLLGFFNKHFLLLLAYEQSNLFANIFTLGAAFTGLFYTLKTIYSLFNVNFKSAFFQKKNLINGLSSKKFWASEPNSNLILFGVYPLFIIILAIIVLSQNYWTTNIIYHSTFGIFFFIIYNILALTYIQNSLITITISLIFSKLLYTLC